MFLIVFIFETFREEEASMMRNPDRPTTLLELGTFDDNDDFQSRKRVNRISSPEKWEIKQVGVATKIFYANANKSN